MSRRRVGLDYRGTKPVFIWPPRDHFISKYRTITQEDLRLRTGKDVKKQRREDSSKEEERRFIIQRKSKKR